MDNLSNYLRSEIQKYKDIDHIYSKLEQDGEIQKIYNLFSNLFQNESEFTINELIKIEEERNEKISIREQYRTNIALFKSNLILIIQMISIIFNIFLKVLVDNAFKSVLHENNQKLKNEDQGGPNQTADGQDDIDDIKQPFKTLDRKSANSKPKKRKNSNQPVNISTDKSTSSDQRKKSSIHNLSTSKVNSPLNQILHASPSRDQSLRIDNRSLSKDISQGSIKHNSHIGTSFFSSKNPNDLSRTSVQSEFNHITGSVTFSQSKRELWTINQTPGPADYHADKSSPSSLRRSPSPTIGKAPRGSWLDTCARTESPGPGGLYPSHRFIKK